MGATNHDVEEKQVKSIDHSPDASTKDKPLYAHEETFHEAAERGQLATDR
jgi:hypothetical protein